MGYNGFTPADQDRRAALGLPYATGADEPPDWHNHPGMTGPADEPRHDQPGTQPEARAAA